MQVDTLWNQLTGFRMRILPLWSISAGALLLARTLGWAQGPQIDQLLSQLEQVQTLSGVTISPDGKWVTWNQPARDNSANSEIYLSAWKNPPAAPQRITAGDGKQSLDEHGLVWSPDSKQVAFLSNAGSSQEQVFVKSVDDNKPARKLTNLNGDVRDLCWSPDGKEIAFLYAEGGGGGGPLEAEPAQTGPIGAEIHNQRLTTVKAEGGDIRQFSPANLNIYEYDWAPDGQRFAAIAAPGPADNNWWIARLYVLAVEPSEMKLIYQPPTEQQIAVPRWSPDGQQIGFIGGIMSDEGFVGGDLFTMPGTGGTPRDVTRGRKASVSGFRWESPNKVLLTEDLDGGGAIAAFDTSTGESERLWRGDEALHEDGNYPNLALAKDGRTSAIIRSTWALAPEVWAGPLADWQRLTNVNAGQRPHWGKAESITWTSGGFPVQGWLIYPENFDLQKRYPMVVGVHGGPAGMHSASWPSTHFDMSVMAGLGYFVFFPNPRGSYGEGEAFTKANVKDFGGGDLRDILAGVDAVLKKAPVDSNRIGITGWSYGGYMTMWTVTQTNRFRAAVAGAGISDWLSYYGENMIDQWTIPYFGASVYDDPAVYAKSSPITYIKHVKTPTLVVVGERDGECPAPQSFEFWHALKTLNVPTQLVVYAGEGHSFHDPKDRLDVLRRTLAWFDQYLQK